MPGLMIFSATLRRTGFCLLGHEDRGPCPPRRSARAACTGPIIVPGRSVIEGYSAVGIPGAGRLRTLAGWSWAASRRSTAACISASPPQWAVRYVARSAAGSSAAARKWSRTSWGLVGMARVSWAYTLQRAIRTGKVSKILRPVSEGGGQPRSGIVPDTEGRRPRHVQGLASFLDREPAKNAELGQLCRCGINFFERGHNFVEVDPGIGVHDR